MTASESRGVAKLLAKIKDSMEEKKYYEGENVQMWNVSKVLQSKQICSRCF